MADRKHPTRAARPTLPASSASGFAIGDLADADDDGEPFAEGQRPVVLASYPTAIEAELVKSRLEAEGIPCDLLDLHTASIGGPLALAVGGVKVRVHEHNAELARDVIAGIGTVALSDEDEEQDAEQEEQQRLSSAMTAAKRTPDALASRALTSSVVGAVLLPPLGLYSLWLVWRALHVEGELSRGGRIKLGLALGFDALTSLWLLPFL